MREIKRGQHIVTFKELMDELFDVSYSDNTQINDLTHWIIDIYDVGKENLTATDWLKITAMVKTLKHLKAKWRLHFNTKCRILEGD